MDTNRELIDDLIEQLNGLNFPVSYREMHFEDGKVIYELSIECDATKAYFEDSREVTLFLDGAFVALSIVKLK